MSKIFIDAGTTYSKLISVSNPFFELNEYFIKQVEDKFYYILPSKKLKSFDLCYERSCGHMSNPTENEIVALAKGCKSLVDANATILDLGSRDAKWIKFRDSKFQDMDWNTSCASSTGATIEMLLKFYDINNEDLSFQEEKIIVTCGIFGLERIMDDISNGVESKIAVSKFIHGIAFNAWNFTKQPKKLYLSGGFCENKCFTDSLKNYCEVIPIGRFKLCEGLLNE